MIIYLPKELWLIILSYLKDMETIDAIHDFVPFKNLDYFHLIRLLYPHLFPIKLIAVYTIPEYDWRGLYFGIIKMKELKMLDVLAEEPVMEKWMPYRMEEYLSNAIDDKVTRFMADADLLDFMERLVEVSEERYSDAEDLEHYIMYKSIQYFICTDKYYKVPLLYILRYAGDRHIQVTEYIEYNEIEFKEIADLINNIYVNNNVFDVETKSRRVHTIFDSLSHYLLRCKDNIRLNFRNLLYSWSDDLIINIVKRRNWHYTRELDENRPISEMRDKLVKAFCGD